MFDLLLLYFESETVYFWVDFLIFFIIISIAKISSFSITQFSLVSPISQVFVRIYGALVMQFARHSYFLRSYVPVPLYLCSYLRRSGYTFCETVLIHVTQEIAVHETLGISYFLSEKISSFVNPSSRAYFESEKYFFL